LSQDLRFAFRALFKSPWFAAIAIVTLALGIAVNTSVFSIINGFLLRPLPVPHPGQLVVLALQQAGDHSLQKFSYLTLRIFAANPLPLATSSRTVLLLVAYPPITGVTTASSLAFLAIISRLLASSQRSAGWFSPPRDARQPPHRLAL
jgi:hypothetical protein